MAGQRVGNFVRHHDRQSGFILADRKNAFVDRDFAAWQTERVLLRRGKKSKLPLVIGTAGYPGNSLTDTLNHLRGKCVARRSLGPLYFLVGR